jgi:hypothetical protein
LLLPNFLARIAPSNFVDTVAPHALTSLGRQETREKENKFNTRESTEDVPLWWPPRLTDTAESYQDPILTISEAAGNALVLSPSRMTERTQATKKETARKRMNQTLFSGRDVILRAIYTKRMIHFYMSRQSWLTLRQRISSSTSAPAIWSEIPPVCRSEEA